MNKQQKEISAAASLLGKRRGKQIMETEGVEYFRAMNKKATEAKRARKALKDKETSQKVIPS